MKRPIGVFDSGVGGLTVIKTLKNILKKEDIIYIGDNYNCPYGNKTVAQLYGYASKIVEYFISQNVKLIVLACNTTSANVLDQLQENYPDVKIIGVIDATVSDFISQGFTSTLIIATEATIKSHKYSDEILKQNQNIKIFAKATPALVPLVESGIYKNGIFDTLHEYLDEYKGKVESIILGCTHYPILTGQIETVMPSVKCISSSHAICYEVEKYLKENNLLNTSGGKVEINTTGDVEEFVFSSQGFFDYGDIEVKYLNLGD